MKKAKGKASKWTLGFGGVCGLYNVNNYENINFSFHNNICIGLV